MVKYNLFKKITFLESDLKTHFNHMMLEFKTLNTTS